MKPGAISDGYGDGSGDGRCAEVADGQCLWDLNDEKRQDCWQELRNAAADWTERRGRRSRGEGSLERCEPADTDLDRGARCLGGFAPLLLSELGVQLTRSELSLIQGHFSVEVRTL